MELKSDESTVSYNLLLPVDQYTYIKRMSVEQSLKKQKLVSMAHIIRRMIEEMIETEETST